jgi:hypothetical protein
LRIGWVDSIAEPSELSNHSLSAVLLRPFADGKAAFFITDCLVQDQPNQPTLSMCDGPDGLVMPQTRDAAAIGNFEDTSFDLYGCISRLVEDASHVAVARGRVL